MLKYALTLCITLLFAPPALADEKEISLATLNWEPYVGEELEYFGFTSHIITEAFKRVGYRVQYTFLPWARLLKQVAAGKFDAGCAAYYSEERAEIYAFSEPYAHGPVVLYKRKDRDISYRTLTDLKPYRIGVARGYVNDAEFDAAEYLHKEVANDNDLNMKKLLAQRLDLIAIDKFVAQYIIKTSLPQGADALEPLDPPLADHPIHLIFSKKRAGYEQKVQDFNRGLAAITEDGTVDNILQRHGFIN